MSYLTKYQEWVKSNVIDEASRKELLEIKNDLKEIEDRFYKGLEFGTGGSRGIVGIGTNRINK